MLVIRVRIKPPDAFEIWGRGLGKREKSRLDWKGWKRFRPAFFCDNDGPDSRTRPEIVFDFDFPA